MYLHYSDVIDWFNAAVVVYSHGAVSYSASNESISGRDRHGDRELGLILTAGIASIKCFATLATWMSGDICDKM